MQPSKTNRPLRLAGATLLVAVAALGLGDGGAAADPPNLLTWSPLAPAAAPPGRLHAAMAFDAATGTTVLFGGRSGSQVLGDTWTWDGTTWTAQKVPASPPPLESASMAYDNIGRRIVLFGGIGGDGNATSGTWSWDGATWTALAPASAPPARYAASMAADAVTGTDVVFGGLSAPGSSLGDTWSWDGTTWSPMTPAASPPARSGAAMTFDAARGVVVLFGGTTGSENRADTWVWDGASWTQKSTPAAPPPRNDAAFGFDAATQSAVLFGGSGGPTLSDTWLWNGSTWTTSLPLTLLANLSPQGRSGASIATSPGAQRLVLFGGQSPGPNPIALNDTWSVATLATAPPPTTAPTTTVASGDATTAPTAPTTSTTEAHPSPTTPTAAAPAAHAPPAAAPLVVASRSVHRGDQVRVSGSGFAPGSRVTITFHSVGVVVGTAIADQQGRFTTTVQVPADAPPGPHHLEAAGPATTGGRAVLVAQVSISMAGAHRSWILPAAMVALTVLLAAAAGLVLTTSTHRAWHPRD